MALIIGDIIAIVTSFLFAYLIRIHIDSRPYYFAANPEQFVLAVTTLIPIWTFILAVLGLYNKDVIFNRSKKPETTRLFAAAIIGVMSIISVDFFFDSNLFPVRPIAIYAVGTCFIMLVIMRRIIKTARRLILKKKIGLQRVVIIGDSQSTTNLIEDIFNTPENGYRIVGVISKSKYIPKDLKNKFERFNSLKAAILSAKPDVIFQTDERSSDYVYRKTVENHILYYFIPSEARLSEHMGSLELIGNTPAIMVKVTPLMGGAKVAKRATDIIIGGLIAILAAIPMLVICIIQKILSPKSPIFYSQIRLSRYNKQVKIYKFRSMKIEYSDMSPEKAFRKMQKQGLILDAEKTITQYRKNGDFLKSDPRITRFGNFLRMTSLDELPQLFNVLKGDISLVGPRALVPNELKNYGDRSLLLSVKSGLTGLAQVSGRRNISFRERRALDIYYVQNWSIQFDLKILLSTIKAVILRKGAK